MFETHVTPEERQRRLLVAEARKRKREAARQRRKREVDIHDVIARVHREQRVFDRIIDTPHSRHR